MIIPIIIIAAGIAGCATATWEEEDEYANKADTSGADQYDKDNSEYRHAVAIIKDRRIGSDHFIEPADAPDLIWCHSPQSYSGDGKHKVRAGDSIKASNGVSIKITNQYPGPSAGSAFYFNADMYAGAEKLNLMPVRFVNNCCREIYGIYASMGKYDEADECGRLPLKVTSFFVGPIASRQDLYLSCLNSGYKHGPCADYIPWEAAPAEATHEDGNFKVFTPAGSNPKIGQFLLNQLKQCHRSLLNLFGTKEIAPVVSLRWYLNNGSYSLPHAHVSGHHINWPWVWDEEEAAGLLDEGIWALDDSTCSEYTVARELNPLMWDGIEFHYLLEMGLAEYAKCAATNKGLESEPALKMKISKGDSFTLPISQYEIEVGEIDAENKKVTLISPENSNLHDIHTTAYYSEDEIVAVEDITDKDVTIRVYDVPSNTIPWTVMPVCRETSYTSNYGFFIGKDFYYSINDNPYAQPYGSLSYPDGVSNTVETAYCFWRQIFDSYGEDIVWQFLNMAQKTLEKGLTNVGSEFCWVKSLNEITGADLSLYFSRFDLPYDENDCSSSGEIGSHIDQNKACPPDAK